VWEFSLRPGEISPVHSHTRDYVLYVLQGASAELFDMELNSLGIGELKTGDTVYFRLQGDALVSNVLTLPATHAVRNVSGNIYREILVEIK
jgi:hypothetical protein